MIVTRKQLQLFEYLSKNAFIDTPANLEFQNGEPLNGREFFQFVTLKAALGVLQSMNFDLADAGLTIELVEPHREGFE